MTATIVLPSSTFNLERKAALCALVGEFFLRNPDTILVRAMKNVDITLFDGKFIEELRPIKEYASTCGETEKDEQFLNLKRDWTKLFRGVSPVYGPTAPYACLFLEGNSSQLMEDMAALYLDGGWNSKEAAHDRIDYIGCCWRFLSHVFLLQINAVEKKDITEFGRLTLIEKEFLCKFFAPWIPAFISRAAPFVQTSFYGNVLNLSNKALGELVDGYMLLPVKLKTEEQARKEAEEEEKTVKQMISSMASH